MRSKNSKALTRAEAAHVESVKHLPCSVCPAPGPSDAHHMKQGRHYTVIALCKECHQGSGGWHGTRVRWVIFKMDQIDALNLTLARLGGMS